MILYDDMRFKVDESDLIFDGCIRSRFHSGMASVTNDGRGQTKRGFRTALKNFPGLLQSRMAVEARRREDLVI